MDRRDGIGLASGGQHAPVLAAARRAVCCRHRDPSWQLARTSRRRDPWRYGGRMCIRGRGRRRRRWEVGEAGSVKSGWERAADADGGASSSGRVGGLAGCSSSTKVNLAGAAHKHTSSLSRSRSHKQTTRSGTQKTRRSRDHQQVPKPGQGRCQCSVPSAAKCVISAIVLGALLGREPEVQVSVQVFVRRRPSSSTTESQQVTT